MRVKSVVGCLLVALSVVAFPVGRAHALFHFSVIDEVLSSWDGDPEQQFVEVRMLLAAQNLVSNSVLAAFDENGVYVDDVLVLPGDVANGVAGGTWTMATEAFQAAHGFTADFDMPAGIPLGGGMICWGAPGVLPPADPGSWDHTDPANYVDCLAYGTYAGPSNVHVGSPTPLVAEGHSLVRVAETDDNLNDFACADVAMPTNNAGASVEVQATVPCTVEPRQSGLQVTPDLQRTLVSKDVGDERWAITRNEDDLTVTGNVFFPEGGEPLFIFCEQTGQSGEDLDFACSGSDSCPAAPCPGDQWQFIADVTLPESFFLPPAADAGAAIARAVRAAVVRGAGADGSDDPGAAAHARPDDPSGGVPRQSGLQVTPDLQRTLVSKDVGDERWAITRNEDDLTVTGNVFFPEGGEPLFIFCEQTGQSGEDLDFACSGSDSCPAAPCPGDQWQFIADVTLPESFFLPPAAP